MSVLSIYDQYGPEIQKLFYSTINVKILLLLNEEPAPINHICAHTGNTHAAILGKIRHLEDHGLVRRSNGSWALTAVGRVLARKIAALIFLYRAKSGREMPEDEGPAARRQVLDNPAAVLEMYDENMKEIHTILRSSILTRILFSLGEDMTERTWLRQIIGCSSPNFRANIKKLIALGFVREEGYHFTITPSGGTFAAGLRDIILTHAVIAEQRQFWKDHSLEEVPGFALDSLGDLTGAQLIGDDETNSFQNFEHFLRIVAEADCMHGVSSWANPSIADAIAARAVEGIPVELVVSPDCALQLAQDPYREKIEALQGFPNMRFYVTDLSISVGLTVTDKCISCGLYFSDGLTYDPLQDLYSQSPQSLRWGKRLFEYYKSDAIPMEEFIIQVEEGRFPS